MTLTVTRGTCCSCRGGTDCRRSLYRGTGPVRAEQRKLASWEGHSTGSGEWCTKDWRSGSSLALSEHRSHLARRWPSVGHQGQELCAYHDVQGAQADPPTVDADAGKDIGRRAPSASKVNNRESRLGLPGSRNHAGTHMRVRERDAWHCIQRRDVELTA